VFSQGALPIILGGDHSIGFPTIPGIAQCTSRRIGIIHFDRHADIQEKDADAVYMSFDIDSVDCGFVPGTGWPEPGGFLPREALGLVGRVAKEGLCGMEIVEVSPPYDTSDITALFATRV